MHCHTQCPYPAEATVDPCLPRDSLTLAGKSGSASCGSLLLSPGSWCTQGFVCALQGSVSPGPGKFWQIHGGVNRDLFQEGLCHTQVCCTQRPCGRLLLTCTFAGDTQTQFWLSLCEVSGSWCTHSLFEPFECLWRVWGLILSVILPLLLSCWGFSFALVRGVSFLVGSNILLSTVVQQRVVILGFSQTT